MPDNFTAVPTPIAPAHAASEATRLMPPMLRQLTEHRHCPATCVHRALAVSMKHYIVDLIERADGRA